MSCYAVVFLDHLPLTVDGLRVCPLEFTTGVDVLLVFLLQGPLTLMRRYLLEHFERPLRLVSPAATGPPPYCSSGAVVTCELPLTPKPNCSDGVDCERHYEGR